MKGLHGTMTKAMEVIMVVVVVTVVEATVVEAAELEEVEEAALAMHITLYMTSS